MSIDCIPAPYSDTKWAVHRSAILLWMVRLVLLPWNMTRDISPDLLNLLTQYASPRDQFYSAMLHFHRYAAPFLLFLRALAVAQESGGCRFSNGTLLPGTQEFSQYAPCAETGNLATVCCALIRGNEPGGNLSMGATRDECLPNGICQNRWTQSKDGLPVTAWVGLVRRFCVQR